MDFGGRERGLTAPCFTSSLLDQNPSETVLLLLVIISCLLLCLNLIHHCEVITLKTFEENDDNVLKCFSVVFKTNVCCF